ncbi:YkvI family membrane protein [Effusibacillus lacus]|uniref:YkvI family membrane protein n=1 Tax=Effusibacillus lacus TaxID=1348429 RepID=UPI001043BC16|nr:hypothetical protein [Effusibacillus lacus]TCS75322.1 putative membrane protein YkvI [Effusibacillus lacus]
MDKKQILQSFQIGFTYIGTVVGAGFASGQEILKFFTIHGDRAYIAILLSTFLFAWVGTKMLLLGARLQASSYRQLTSYLFGDKLAALIDLFMMVMLFGVTVAMLAGVGALFHENLKVPFQLGVLLTMGVTYLTINRGIPGLLAANSIIVPLMLSLICFIFIKTAITPSAHTEFADSRHESLSWLASGVSYAAFNLGLAVSVLVPLGNEIKDRKSLMAGGIIGAAGLGGMLLGAHYAMSERMPGILEFEVPMAQITATYGIPLQVLFVLALWGEIFSTLIANVYGLGSQLSSPRHPDNNSLVTVLILTSAFFVSQVGFSNIVTYLYPVFGYLSFLLLIFLLWPRTALPRRHP